MTLKEFIERSLSGENLPDFIIGTVTESIAKDLYNRTGLSLLGYKITIKSKYVRHIRNEHGSVIKEANRGQVAIKKDDYLLIPEIVKRFDIAQKSVKKTNYMNNTAIEFVKQYKNEYWVIEQILEKDKHLSLTTMYIKKKLVS